MDAGGDRRTDSAALFEELKALRKGFGLIKARPADHFGPAVRRVSGVTDADPEWAVQEKVRGRFDQLTDGLDEPDRTVSRAALGFGLKAAVRYLERLKKLAPELDRNPRTVQRLSDDALRLLAERAVADPGAESVTRTADPWRLKVVRTKVLLDEPVIEVIESRRIASNVAGLGVIQYSATVTPPRGSVDPPDLNRLRLRVLAGAEVISERQVAANRKEFDLRLSRVLAPDEELDIEFRVWVPGMSPFYVCTPLFRCELFDLRIRFDRDRMPRRIQVVDGAFSPEAGDPTVRRETIEPDQVGEVRHVFRELAPYRSYGLLWG